MSASELPDYERPPVREIVAAVQYPPAVQFGLPEIVRLDRELEDWSLVDAQPALDPIVEPPPGSSAGAHVGFGFGAPPQRAVFRHSDEAAWQLQVQHDRIAVNEIGSGPERPSSKRVIPRLVELSQQVTAILAGPPRSGTGLPAPAEIVELVYVNDLGDANGFTSWDAIGDLLHGLAPTEVAGHGSLEGVQSGWSYPLHDGERFAGRLRAQVAPAPTGGAQLVINSRRYVGEQSFDAVLERCHADIVQSFTDMTTPHAHTLWGRIR